MTEEQKEERPSEEVETTEETEVETTGDDETADDSKESNEESKQHEAELKKEREAREKAEKAAAELAFKVREKKRATPKEEEEVLEEEEDKPLTRKELQEALAKEREAARKEVLASEADRIAESLATSASEKAHILEKWKNRSFPSHLTLSEQLEECYVLANKKKLLGERDEAMRALKGKQGTSTDASTTHRAAQPGSQPKMSGPNSQVIAESGFKWNNTNRRFEKKLANGQTLVHDTKTKRNYLV